MAIAIPILLMATEAGVAMAAALSISTGMLAAGAGLVMAATGISAKINKAASNVFGEDLVNFANIAGSVALAAGWDPSAMMNSMSGAAANAGNAATAAGGAVDAASGALPAAANAAPGAFDAADAAMAVDAGNATSYTGAMPSGDAAGGAASPSTASPQAAPATPPSGGDGVDLMRRGERSYSNSAEAAAVKTYAPPADSSGGGALKKWYDAQPAQVKAALVTTGGQALAGVAQGYSRNSELTRAEAERKRREERFNTGSGTAFTYTAPSTARTGK